MRGMLGPHRSTSSSPTSKINVEVNGNNNQVLLDAGGYDSSYEGDEEQVKRKKRKHDLSAKELPKTEALPGKAVFRDEYSNEGRRTMQSKLRSLTAYDRHKLLINEYFLSFPGATKLLQRDQSRDKKDFDVIKENHQFLWEEEDAVDTWGKQLAKKYHDKLFKEYCICDLRKYKENKVGIRWRIEKEVVTGKGQFSCGEQKCETARKLRTWEVNFGYIEHGQKKNSLVKIRLCDDCSCKLNYHQKRKEVTKSKKRKSKHKSKKTREHKKDEGTSDESDDTESKEENPSKEGSSSKEEPSVSTDIWKESQQTVEEKSRDEEFEQYLEDLFL
uniref:EOG090X0H59 n=1 Tax=Evadne anonyx TaxID=141404 RepID=A0A9N6WXZ6_9CRUS|nr:EOG090X0H59 [Evadne anonyx]